MLKQVFFLSVLFLSMPVLLKAQKDSSLLPGDSLRSALPAKENIVYGLNDILKENRFLNSTSVPVSLMENKKRDHSKDMFFYLIAFIVLMLGVLKVSYSRYFTNLFRVFFNTSLRQGQLTDQLLQAKLPSLLFNMLFVMTSGLYIYFLLNHFGKIENHDNIHILLLCMAAILLIYLVKFSILKFTGWITGYKNEAETYIFIVFLINKIISVCLIPLIIIIAFSNRNLVDAAMLLSFIVIGIMLLMRFFRSFGLLQSRIKVSRLHFFIYITGIEILPLLLIYKAAVFLISKNL